MGYEYDSARPSATTRSASRCKVQCLRPSGALLQASRSAGLSLHPALAVCRGVDALPAPQPLFDEALAEAFNRSAPYREGSSDGAVFPALSRFEQNTGARHFAGRVCPAVQQVFELFTFIVIERHEIFFLGMLVVLLMDRLTRLYLMPILSIKFTVMGY